MKLVISIFHPGDYECGSFTDTFPFEAESIESIFAPVKARAEALLEKMIVYDQAYQARQKLSEEIASKYTNPYKDDAQFKAFQEELDSAADYPMDPSFDDYERENPIKFGNHEFYTHQFIKENRNYDGTGNPVEGPTRLLNLPEILTLDEWFEKYSQVISNE